MILEKKYEAIKAWLDSAMLLSEKLPVIGKIPEMAPADSLAAVEIVNFGHLRVLRTLAECLPKIEVSGNVSSLDKKLVDDLYAALVRNNLIKS